MEGKMMRVSRSIRNREDPGSDQRQVFRWTCVRCISRLPFIVHLCVAVKGLSDVLSLLLVRCCA